MRNKSPNILVIGLGQIGYANAEYLTTIGFHADGYDINKNATEKAIADRVIKREPRTFQDYDYYMICVSTHDPRNMFTPNFDGLEAVMKKINREGKEKALITIESTISKQFCDRILSTLGHRCHVVHVPHRYYDKEKGKHGVKQLRVLGGYKQCCVEEAKNFYGNVLGIPFYEVGSLHLAALSKIVENTHRFLEIAFAEELKLLCDSYALDFEELREAVNTKWNVNILEAQKGIGGHCLPKDTQMYLDLAVSISPSILESAVQIDNSFKSNLLDKITFGVVPFDKKVITAN
jgi:nucleotide sugar dehydrogenase